MVIHKNSLEVYHKIMNDGLVGNMAKKVFEIICNSPFPLSDYAVLQKIKPGSDNLNLVRPRISELFDIKPPVVREGPPAKSHYKNCNVRTTEMVPMDTQDMFA